MMVSTNLSGRMQTTFLHSNSHFSKEITTHQKVSKDHLSIEPSGVQALKNTNPLKDVEG